MRDRAKLIFILPVVFLFHCSAHGQVSDVVRFRDPKTGQVRARSGQIVEYSGKSLVIKVASGNEVAIPSPDVVSFDANWSAAHREANRLFAANDFSNALASYNKAILEKPPEWIVRRLMSQRVLCLSALNKHAEAADSFFRIVAVDSNTQYFGTIPLNWQTRRVDQNLTKQCEEWLGSTDSSKQLVAASWLLSTSSRNKAIQTLDRLANQTDPRIALLAIAQKWRTEIVNATEQDIEKWQGIAGRMPKDVRSGPLFIVGKAMIRLKMDADEIALVLMQIPTLYHRHHQLAASSLFETATVLKASNRQEEAEIILRELIAKYSQTSYAAEAQKLLN